MSHRDEPRLLDMKALAAICLVGVAGVQVVGLLLLGWPLVRDYPTSISTWALLFALLIPVAVWAAIPLAVAWHVRKSGGDWAVLLYVWGMALGSLSLLLHYSNVPEGATVQWLTIILQGILYAASAILIHMDRRMRREAHNNTSGTSKTSGQ
jgi:hypothetical protein